MAYDEVTAQLARENEQLKARLLEVRYVVLRWLEPDGISSASAMVELTKLVDPLPGGIDARPCTCHQDDNPPKPCPRKYALSECRAAASS